MDRRKRMWLKRYGTCCDEIAILEERIAFLNDAILSAKHPRFNAGGNGGKGETAEEKVNRRFVLEEVLERKKEERDALYRQTAAVIAGVKNLSYRRILQMIYLERCSVPVYVARFHYSRTYVYRLLEQAEESIEI